MSRPGEPRRPLILLKCAGRQFRCFQQDVAQIDQIPGVDLLIAVQIGTHYDIRRQDLPVEEMSLQCHEIGRIALTIEIEVPETKGTHRSSKGLDDPVDFEVMVPSIAVHVVEQNLVAVDLGSRGSVKQKFIPVRFGIVGSRPVIVVCAGQRPDQEG